MKNVYCTLFLFFTVFISSHSLLADNLPIDLTKLDAFVRLGFKEAWTKEVPRENDSQWKVIPGKKGDRSLQVRNLKLPGVPEWKAFKKIDKDYTFTYLFTFNLNQNQLKKDALGLYLAQIGQNWEVYLNGELVRKELYLDDKENITILREMRQQKMLLPYRLLRENENILAFRIVGDPTFDRTGFYMNRNYYIDSIDSLGEKTTVIIDYMLISVYLFFGLYHFFLFVRRKKEVFNLWVSLGIILLSIRFLTRTNLVFNIFHDTGLIKHFELISMIMMLVFLTAFMDAIVKGGLSLFTKIFFGFSVIIAIMIIPFEREFLPIWQKFILPVPFLYILIFNMIFPFYKIVKNHYNEYREKNLSSKIFKSFFKGIFQSIPGSLLVGLSIILITAIVDTYNMMHGEPSTFTKYSFFILTIGLVLILANRFINVHNEMEILNITLEQKVEDRTKKLKMAKDEVEAAMEELEAMNDNLLKINTDLENAHRTMTRDMKMAVQVQTSFFPKGIPENDTWDVDFVFLPMAGVSGDLYDFFIKKNKVLGVGLFDVSGHGIASGLLTLLARSVVFHRFMNKNDKKLNRVIEEINKNLITEIGNLDNYITGILLNFHDDYIEYVNAGHPDIIIKRAQSGIVKTIEPKHREFKGHFLGIQSMETPFNVLNVKIQKDDVMILYTDCLNENLNKDREPFGYDRIMESIKEMPNSATAHEVLAHLMDRFYSFIAGAPISDDLTIIVIKRK